MSKMQQTSQIASFALYTSYGMIPANAMDQLKRHLLDAVGSFIHATNRPAIQKLLKLMTLLQPGVALQQLSPDRLCQLYTALIRYPDFMDNYLGKKSTCHPSDNIGPLFAATHLGSFSGKEFMTAMAIAYTIECRLIEEVPVMIKGFDHTLLLAYSTTAAVSRLLGLNEEETANALAMAGCNTNPLVTCRAAYTYEWKGFASSLVTQNCFQLAMLAKQGMTGPIKLFETPEKGFNDIFGMKLDYDWSKEKFDLISKCILKSYNAEVHTQSSIEAVIELRKAYNIAASDVESIDVTTFLTAYHIVGGGEYGDRKTVRSKEQADHSLPYVVAVALIDGDVYPAQLLPERVNQPDVQELLQKVNVHTSFPLHKPVKLAGLVDPYTAAYPDKVDAKVVITLKNRQKYELEKQSYNGFHDQPLGWQDCIYKFKKLTKGIVNEEEQTNITELIREMEITDPSSFCKLLQEIIAKENSELFKTPV
jgi:2-methylcitrate dehydratase